MKPQVTKKPFSEPDVNPPLIPVIGTFTRNLEWRLLLEDGTDCAARPDQINAYPLVGSSASRVRKLAQDRAALLVLLKEAETFADGYGLDTDNNPDKELREEAVHFAARIRAAILKAEGK